MKIPMIMVAAGAAIALAAPLANAASTKKLSTFPIHKTVKQAKTAKHTKQAKPAGKLGKTTTPRPVTPRPPLYIFVPGYSGPPITADPVNACESSGSNCTDQQLCEYWGENCASTGPPSTDQTGTPAGNQAGATQPTTAASTSEAQSDGSVASGTVGSALDLASAGSADDC